jgi:LmbE family N-acetylglucosaminyl deacetylase
VVTTGLTDRPWRALRWLVLAPHADDETLGTGALIAQAAAAGRFAGLVYITDGSGSHAAAAGGARRLIATRRREGACALSRLTGTRRYRPFHLGWKDAAPLDPGSPKFDRSVLTLTSLCMRLRVDAIAVTARHEPHCDHAAAAELAYVVKGRAKRCIVVAEYCVWADRPDQRRYRAIRSGAISLGLRRYALQAHRSQLTASHGPGFRLPKAMHRMAARDILFVERRK